MSQLPVRSVVVTDLVDSTGLVARVGDAAAHALFIRHDRLARDLLQRFGGREIDKSDGFLLLFAQPSQAVAFALAYHAALRALSAESGEQWRARLGIHVGEVSLHDNAAADIARGAKPVEVEGLAKAIAARLMGLARGGQTLLTGEAFDLARRAGEPLADGELGWQAHGRYRFHGLDEPMEVFEVGVVGQAPLSPPTGNPKAVREITPEEAELLGWRPGPGLEVPGRPSWRLQRKLGAGGFGEVWLAQHARSGAVRVFKYCHDADRLRSFRREVTVFRLLRDALGDRADIARIVDWNLDEAPYFLELEHVDGGDLHAFAEAEGGLHAIPLPLRIELVAQVADALAAAHSLGVLHKDIKPANVLVRRRDDGEPTAVLTDFGIGLVTDRGQLLQRGITMAGFTGLVDQLPTGGSHLYMAPELLQGRAATIQADLYALGVMLYELAAGSFKPIAPGWQRDIDDELLQGDIATLVDGDPSRRPASAAAVARMLRALPQRRAELARQRQAAVDAAADRQRLERAQRRRRWALGLAASLAVVSAVVGYSGWQARLARMEADARRTQAERLLGFVLSDLRQKLQQAGRLQLLDSVGAAALDYFAALPSERLSDDELALRAQALYQLGDVRVSQGDFDGARRAMAESLALARALAARAPDDPDRQFALAQSEYWVGYVGMRSRDHAAAAEAFARYRDIADALVRRDPARIEWQRELGYAHGNLGSLHEATGDLAAARDAFRQRHAIAERLAAADPRLRTDLATSHEKLARVHEQAGELDTALQHSRAALSLSEALLDAAPDDIPARHRLARNRYYAARLLEFTGDDAGALREQQAVATAFDELARLDPSNRRWARERAIALAYLAELLLDAGDAPSARPLLDQARALASEPGGDDPLLAPTVALSEARWLAVAGKAEDARAELVRAEQILQPLLLGAGAARAATLLAELLHQRALIAAAPGTGLDAGVLEVLGAGRDDLRARELRVAILLALDRRDEALALAHALRDAGYRRSKFRDLCLKLGLPLA